MESWGEVEGKGEANPKEKFEEKFGGSEEEKRKYLWI